MNSPRLAGEPLLNKALFSRTIGRYITIWYQSVVFVELHCVALCIGIFFSCCDPLSAMVSFGSAPLKQTQSREIIEPEPLSKPIIDAISKAVIMAMEKHAHGEKSKRKARSLSHSTSSSTTSNTYV